MGTTHKLTILVLVIILAGSCSLYLVSLTPDSFGYYHDDGIYVVTAKALATGHGYRIISLPYEPAQTKYPPFYPFLLSLIWRADSQFPENLSPMMLSSVTATIAFLTLTWLYLTKVSYTTACHALLVIALTAMNWRTIILATGIYSEMVYSLLSVAGLWLAEGNEEKPESWWKKAVLGSVLGLAFLTRTSGISLMIAVASYYLFRRKFREASLIFAVGASFVFAWTVWHATSGTPDQSIGVSYYTSYVRDFIERVGSLDIFLRVIGSNVFMLVLTSIPLVSLGIGYNELQNFTRENLIVISVVFICLVFLLVTGGFLKHTAAGFRLLHIYVLSYLGLHLFWPFTAYDRFLAPILPFLLLFLTTELKSLAPLVTKELSFTIGGKVDRKLSAIFIGFLLLVVASVGCYNYATGIYRSIIAKEFFSSRVSEDRQAIEWINANTDLSAVLLCYRDPQYYLYTARKAVRFSTPRSSAQAQTDEPEKIILRIIKETNAEYLVLTSTDFEQERDSDFLRKTYATLIETFPETFIPEFKSKDGRVAIYSIQTHTSRVVGFP